MSVDENQSTKGEGNVLDPAFHKDDQSTGGTIIALMTWSMTKIPLNV